MSDIISEGSLFQTSAGVIASVKVKKVQHKVYELLRAWEGNRTNEQAYKAILNSVC